MQKHIAEILATSFGLVSGIFTSLGIKYPDELRTMKLAALGAVTGFIISKILKLIDKRFSKTK
jgi:hypothetical protein